MIIGGLFVAAGGVLLKRGHSLSGGMGLFVGVLGIVLVLVFKYLHISLVTVGWSMRICAVGFVLGLLGIHLFRSRLDRVVMGKKGKGR